MNFASDRRTLYFLFFIFLFQGALFFVDFRRGPVWWALLAVAANSFLVFILSLINHNQKHVPIFKSRGGNWTVDLVISLLMGSPASRLSTIHEINHHEEYQGGDDWSCYTNAKGRGLWRLLSYCTITSFRFARKRLSMPLEPHQRLELLTQRILVLTFFAIFVYFRPWLFFFIFAPSWFIGLYFLLAGNLLTHDGCELNTEWNHSRNFLSKTENWFLFNHGFHTAHHVDQQVHWSLLPGIHEQQCAGKIDGRFEVNSYFYYLLKNYTIPL